MPVSQVLDAFSVKWKICSILYMFMVYSEQCSMCCMSVLVQMQMNFQVQVRCVVYTVQCVESSVLPAKDEDLAVERG